MAHGKAARGFQPPSKSIGTAHHMPTKKRKATAAAQLLVHRLSWFCARTIILLIKEICDATSNHVDQKVFRMQQGAPIITLIILSWCNCFKKPTKVLLAPCLSANVHFSLTPCAPEIIL